MAKKFIIVSDLSGEAASEGNLVKVTLVTEDGKRFDADLLRNEVENIIAVARESKQRGRKKQS